MERPFAWPVVFLIAGIVVAEISDWSFGVCLAAGIASAAGGLLVACQRLRATLLGAAVVAAGAAALSVQTQVIPSHDLRRVVGAEPRIVTVRGVLKESPYYRFHEKNNREQALTKMRATAVRFDERGAWTPVCGEIAVTTPGTLPEHFWRGQEVAITGVLALPEGPRAPGLFDYAAHLRRLGIYYTLRALSPADWTAEGSLAPPITERFNRWAREALARGLSTDDEAVRLIWAMALGWKTALNGEVSEPFMRSGTLHVFAISGLHVAMIASIFAGVLRGLRVSRQICGLLVIPAIWFYTAATDWQASAVRSAVMATVVLGSWILRRPADMLNSLAAAAFLILLFDPQQLFQAGFQLSFAVVFCLALFSEWLHSLSSIPVDFAGAAATRASARPGPSLVQRISGGDPLLPWDIRPWWQRGILKGATLVVGLAMGSFAAWLGSLPLIATYFHLLTPVSLLSNLLVVPMSGAALASNFAALFFAWWPPVAEIFNHSAWFWMRGMIVISEWTAAWPGGAIHIAAPGPFAIGAYYALLIALLSGWFLRPRLRWWTAGFVGLLAVAAAAGVVGERSKTTLTVLPLSGGHAVFFDAPGSARDVLVDCGDEDSGKLILKPFLQSRGVMRLGNLVLSHGDDDHVGGAPMVLDHFGPRRIVVPGVPFRSPVYRAAMRDIRERSTNLVEVVAGEVISDWTVLYPESLDKLPLADDKALVLRGEWRGVRILLLPDLGRAGQTALLDRGVDVRSDVVITSVPLRDEPLIDALVETIGPRLIVVADALYPSQARAREALRERLARHRRPVWYTSDTRAVTLRFEPNGIQVLPARTTDQAKPIVLDYR